MNHPVRTGENSDESARILEAAEEQFRRVGCRRPSWVTVIVHKAIVSNAPDDELSSTRNMIASKH
jgi:hypothetical protein